MYAKKSFSFDFTPISVFSDLHGLVLHQSSRVSLKELETTRIEDAISFKATKTLNFPFFSSLGSKFMDDFPTEIEIRMAGSIDADGIGMVYTYFPDTYDEYVKVKETINFNGNNKPAIVKLEYKITGEELDTSWNILEAIKTRAYESFITTMEEHALDLYKSRRILYFKTEGPVDSLDGLVKTFSKK